jgi:hypothetical protein
MTSERLGLADHDPGVCTMIRLPEFRLPLIGSQPASAPMPAVGSACWARLLPVLAAALLLAGCMAPRPGADLPPYGESVRHTKELQTYEPGDPVPPLHGAKAVEAMQHYRQPSVVGSQMGSLP